MTFQPQLTPAELAAMIDREGLAFEYYSTGFKMWRTKKQLATATSILELGYEIRLAPGALSDVGLPPHLPHHNPDNLPADKITEGGRYRGILPSENLPRDEVQYWSKSSNDWFNVWFGCRDYNDSVIGRTSTIRVPINTPFPTTSMSNSENNKTSLERLADVLEMPADHIREAAQAIRDERKTKALLDKVQLIRDGNTAILQNGEIVPRGTPGSTNYKTLNIASTTEPESETPRSEAEKYADPAGPQRRFGCSQERVEEQLLIALEGHPDSQLWGENGLIAATMRAFKHSEQLETELRATQRKLDEANGLLERAMEAMQGAKELLQFLPSEYVHKGTLNPIEYSPDGSLFDLESTLTAITQHPKCNKCEGPFESDWTYCPGCSRPLI